ncbi:hypothetical protein Bca4012_063385 [Brassica carinata]
MTKDLALLIHGRKVKRDAYVNTEELVDSVAWELRRKLIGSSSLYLKTKKLFQFASSNIHHNCVENKGKFVCLGG